MNLILCVYCAFGHHDLNVDVRVYTKLLNLLTKCHFQSKCCSWVGMLSAYENHISKDCKFAETQCQYCKGNVLFMDMDRHLEKNQCMNHEKENIMCPFDCGYVNQNWLMETHTLHKCGANRRTDLYREMLKLGDEREHRHAGKSVPVCHKHFLNFFENKCNDSFRFHCKIDLTQNDSHLFHEIVNLQNMMPVVFFLDSDVSSDSLIVNIVPLDVKQTIPSLQTLKQTLVTVTIVNKATKYPDCETRDFKTVVPFVTNDRRNVLFSKSDVINIIPRIANLCVMRFSLDRSR